MAKVLISILFIVTLSSCQTKQKFDKAKWAEVADLMTFPNRKYMIDDLVQNYRLKGMTYQQLIELLDKPQKKLDSTFRVYYDIDVDYGTDIDPVYTKILSIEFEKTQWLDILKCMNGESDMTNKVCIQQVYCQKRG